MSLYDYRIVNNVMFYRKDRLPSKACILRAVGVKANTFAGNIVSDFYDLYFRNAIDFKKEYKRYYRKEYSSLVDFIEIRFNIPRENAVIMASGRYCMKRMDDDIYRGIYSLPDISAFKEAFDEALGDSIYEG